MHEAARPGSLLFAAAGQRSRLPYLIRPITAGTNDNHRLLPLTVRQNLKQQGALAGTNGKMLALLLAQENERYDTLETSEVRGAGEAPG